MHKFITIVLVTLSIIAVFEPTDGFPQGLFGAFSWNKNEKTLNLPLNVKVKPTAPIQSVYNLFGKRNPNERIEPKTNRPEVDFFANKNNRVPPNLDVNKRNNFPLEASDTPKTNQAPEKILKDKNIIENTIVENEDKYSGATSENDVEQDLETTTEYITESTTDYETTTADDDDISNRISSQVVASLLG